MRWKATVAYDGTDFDGWQSQPDGNTIQDFLEKRLSFLMERSVRIHGSGRTDSGVHARGQVFHFDGEWDHGEPALLQALRTGYPSTIQVLEVKPAEATFHARFSAIRKRYVYQIYEGYASPFDVRYYWSLGRRRLDIEAMNDCAEALLGTHDFTSFSANTGTDKEESPIKELYVLNFQRQGHRIHLTTEASGYAYKMVRSLVGCLVDVGLGKLNRNDVLEILAEKKRTNRVLTAPAQGLFLEQVFY